MKFCSDYENFKHAKPNKRECITAAELPVNRGKNRFVDILPYDDTRVHILPIEGEEGSDYINANYVPGYNSKREYIACQGPLPSTTEDFWRMIWEQKCRVIVMMTKFKENNREKCYNYMPYGEEPIVYGDLEISVNKHFTSTSGHFKLTELQIDLGNETRTITHFNYLEWMDKTAPSDYDKLIDFATSVRKEINRFSVGSDLYGPVCVHCSAGVGRTGSFIVIDRCLQLLRDKPKMNMYIDIYGMVWEMRQHRCLLVQTDDQYALVHKCISYAIENKCYEIIFSNEYFIMGDSK